MATTPQEPDSRLSITQSDLKDQQLYHLNEVINDLYSRISGLAVNGNFLGTANFADILLNTDRDPTKLADHEVLNKGEISKLGATSSATTTAPASTSGGGGGGTTTVHIQYPPATNFANSIDRLLNEKLGEAISVLDFGAIADGSTDCTTAFNNAFAVATGTPGGKKVLIPAAPTGQYYKINSKITIDNSSGLGPIMVVGEGEGSLIKRGGTIATGSGLFDIKGTNIHFRNFKVDGAVTSPTGYIYSDFSSDPMNTLLTVNTSFWVHGPSSNVTWGDVTIMHTGGYSILLSAANASNQYDTNSYDISDIKIINCNFLNNRPNLFGTSSGDKNYGSWTGGIFANTYGIQSGSNYLSTVQGLLVQGCYFSGNYGNCVWSHLYGFDQLFFDFRVLGCTFIDCGLDGTNFGGVSGGCVIGNRFRRIGYIPGNTSADVSATNYGVPKWLTNANAVAIDTSGLVKNVTYANNTMISVNGGDIDADGFGDGAITGNVGFTPRSTDIEYAEDHISISGPAADGVTWSYGCQPSNSSNTSIGGENIQITGNTFINKYGGAIRLSSTRSGLVSSNNIYHPAVAGYAPIIMLCIGSGAYQRTYNTTVINNCIFWNPSTSSSCIQELVIAGNNFTAGDKNWVHGNQIIGNVNQFLKDPNTNSTCGIALSLDANSLLIRSDTFFYRNRATATGISFDYLAFGVDKNTSFINAGFLYDAGIIGVGGYCSTSGTSVTWVSGDTFGSFVNGGHIIINAVTYTILNVVSSTSITLTTSAGTQTAVVFNNPVYQYGNPLLNIPGSITTGSRSTIGIQDSVSTNVVSADGFIAITDALINQQLANKLDATYALLWYDSTHSTLKLSTSVTAGVRNWTNLSGGGSSPPFDDSTAIVFNHADNTKLVKLDASLLTTGTTRVIKAQDASYTMAGVDITNTFTATQYFGAGTSISTSSAGFFKVLDGSGNSRVLLTGGGVSGQASLSLGDGSNFVNTIKAYNGLTASVTWVLPPADGSSGYVLSTNGAGQLSWVANGGGGGATPGGSDTDIQYNKAGVLFGDNNLKWIYGTPELRVSGIITASGSIASAVAGAGLPAIQAGGGNFQVNGDGATSAAGVISSTAGLSVTTITNYNSIQTSGGVYGTTGLTADQALYLLAKATHPNNPGTGYGAWGWKTGSTFWYWNGSAYATADLSSISGSAITSINSQTGPAITLAGTSGITITQAANTITISGAGASVAGSNKQVQFNDSGAFGATSDLTFDKTAKLLTVNAASAAVAGLSVTTGFIQSDTGFYSTGSASTTLNLPNGGATAFDFIALRSDGVDSSYILSGSNSWGLNVDASGSMLLRDRTASINPITLVKATGATNFGGVIQLNNNTQINALDTGGTPRQIFKLGNANDLVFGGSAGIANIYFYNGTTQSMTILNSTGYLRVDSGVIESTGIATAPSSPPDGTIYYNSTSKLFNFRQNGAWVTITTSAVNSVTGGTGVTVSPTTGAVTVSIGQSVGTADTPTFASLNVTANAAIGGYVQTTGNVDAHGGALATNGSVRITNAGAIQNITTINMSSDITCGGAIAANGNISTNAAVLAGGNVSCGQNKVFAVYNGMLGGVPQYYYGIDETSGLTCGSHTLYFKGGILYAAV